MTMEICSRRTMLRRPQVPEGVCSRIKTASLRLNCVAGFHLPSLCVENLSQIDTLSFLERTKAHFAVYLDHMALAKVVKNFHCFPRCHKGHPIGRDGASKRRAFIGLISKHDHLEAMLTAHLAWEPFANVWEETSFAHLIRPHCPSGRFLR